MGKFERVEKGMPMKESTREWVLGVVIGACLAAPGIAIILGVNWWRCASKWEASGFLSSYGPVQGCLINAGENGRWVPAENYRALP